MLPRLPLIVLAICFSISAQPVDITATGVFGDGQSRLVIGGPANSIEIELVSLGTRTILPDTTGFTPFTLVQARVTVTGNPYQINLNIPQQQVIITLASQGGSATLRGTLQVGYFSSSISGVARPTIYMNLISGTALLGDVAYSFATSTVELWDAFFPTPPPTSYVVPGRATRAKLSFSISSLQVTAVAGRPEMRTFQVNAPAGTLVTGGFQE
jgi:hypothetical protein